ncbi:MAG TPA: hypothetical protein VF142_21660, partial [Longimicrobium sp.]
PCGESWDCLREPCAPAMAAGADVAAGAVTPEQLDQRSVQQGGLSEAVRAERQQQLESSRPPGAPSATAADHGARQDASAQGATPESLDRRSVQQGGGQ